MKKCIQLLLMFALVCFWATSASALYIGFEGVATFSDSDGDKFRETISFADTNVKISDPEDALLKDGSLILSTITLDSEDPYNFNPSWYEKGFQLLDAAGNELLVADWEVTKLEDFNTFGFINSRLVGNLYNVTQGSGYTLGTSTIIDALLSGYDPGGAFGITTQFGDTISNFINADGFAEKTFSADVVPTPEPGTLLLLGSGLAGLAAAKRRKKS